MKKKTPQKETLSISQLIGKSLAFVQVQIDDLFQIGFQKIGEAKKVPVRKNDPLAKKIVFKSLSTIADIGTSFYKEYKNFKKK